VPSPQLEETVSKVPVDPVRAVLRTPNAIPEMLYAFLSVVSASIEKRPFGDSEEWADLCRPDARLEMLFAGVSSETEVFLDQSRPTGETALNRDYSGGKLSCHTIGE
jgi:hypothetical protein